MKISIGTNIKDGPWGGGNLFAINITKFLKSKGHDVCDNLKDDDIDIILITEPRITSESSAFTDIDVLSYLKFKNKNALVVHRINECDERKNTNYVNSTLIKANKTADGTVFVSNWLKNLFVKQGIKNQNLNVILGGADSEIFNSKLKENHIEGEKFKIVTHHWGNNWNKGFDIYSRLDTLLENSAWRSRIDFTYVGNLPKDFEFKYAKHVTPLSGLSLANELKKHDIYITASLNEPSGNHHIEAAQCGLPLLYIDSGGIPEYCHSYGLMFSDFNFEEKLLDMITNYEKYKNNMQKYPFNANKMCSDYLNLFNNMYEKKEQILSDRELPSFSLTKFLESKIRSLIKKVR
jgi:glycosyltransferase involved in cell wall biosynthesis